LTEPLRAPHVVDYSYRRSTGGAVRVFLTGLAHQEIWASRSAGGTVEIPPVDWDPETGAEVQGFVRLGDRGVVRSWTWVADPDPGHPLDRPFAWALVQIEGADSAFLHAVDVEGEASMRSGMVVRVDWRQERTGSIRDIRAFVPDSPGLPTEPANVGEPVRAAAVASGEEHGPLVEELVVSNVTMPYTYEPGLTLSGFLRGLGEHRIEAGRCPSCSGVYVPPRARCPQCRVGPLDRLELSDRGSIATYTVVHLPFPGLTMDLPFVCAWVRLDGADVAFAHLLGEVRPEEVTVGQRVEAVWVAEHELAPTWESIRYFRPSVVSAGRPRVERP
jgi:uncharacterized protein